SERISHSERTGDFRMALRWTYIALLIALDEDALLEVRGWKTNRDYREEMRSHAGADAFNALSEAFDYYWYGGHDLDASTYRNLLELVRHLQSKPVSA
ncbi:MAG: DUF4129 domain-containing protein, partial [Saprospiraceae bacterium]|nr:DUF4129 domain-containing protein [Saprospiraceae bacterium]